MNFQKWELFSDSPGSMTLFSSVDQPCKSLVHRQTFYFCQQDIEEDEESDDNHCKLQFIDIPCC